MLRPQKATYGSKYWSTDSADCIEGDGVRSLSRLVYLYQSCSPNTDRCTPDKAANETKHQDSGGILRKSGADINQAESKGSGDVDGRASNGCKV